MENIEKIIEGENERERSHTNNIDADVNKFILAEEVGLCYVGINSDGDDEFMGTNEQFQRWYDLREEYNLT